MGRLITIQHILNNELGLELDETRPQTISSPFRNDSSPSFRIYSFTGDEEDYERGAYDWGTSTSYNNIALIAEIRGIPYNQAIEVYRTEYNGEVIDKSGSVSKYKKIDILLSFIELDHLPDEERSYLLTSLIFNENQDLYDYLFTSILEDTFEIIKV